MAFHLLCKDNDSYMTGSCDRVDPASGATNGIVPTQAPADMPWDVHEMIVTDPDGNRLRFGSGTG